jgi:hypothetical protein
LIALLSEGKIAQLLEKKNQLIVNKQKGKVSRKHFLTNAKDKKGKG